MLVSRVYSACKLNSGFLSKFRSAVLHEQEYDHGVYRTKNDLIWKGKEKSNLLRKFQNSHGHNNHGKIYLNSMFLLATTIVHSRKENGDLQDPENKDIADLLTKGQKMAHEKCNLEKIEEVYIEALHLALERKNQNIIAIVQDQLANLALGRNQFRKAEELFRNVMKNLLNSGKEENDPSILEISLKLSMIYAALGNTDHAVRGYQWVIESCKSNLKDMGKKNSSDELKNLQALLGMTLDSYGRFLFVHGKHKEALVITQEAANLCMEIFGEEDCRTLVLYNDIGTILHQLGHTDEAIKMIKKAIDLSSKKKDRIEHSDLAVFWVNLANIYSLQGENEKADSAFDAALKEAAASKDVQLKQRILNFRKDWKSSSKS